MRLCTGALNFSSSWPPPRSWFIILSSIPVNFKSMQHVAPINFQEARDFGSTMNVTYRFIRQNMKGLGKSLLFFAAPAVLLGSVFYHEVFSRMLSIARTEGMYGVASPFGADEYFTSLSFWIYLLAALVFMLIGGVFPASTTHAYILVYQDRPTPQIYLGEEVDHPRGPVR